ncbi:carnitine 3-dehydrogenase [Phenylobacterium montanum]|uniref:L-carnitine dehydrogenase n=1 Tax=Phenylobacterium montanum TaxID=2823693 RepID=A0A975G0P4_9CAUL|nr:carnitine 3-dehydrogenase [Caulobacter sp. S6]QUD88332.1 carnitine 3-dehydrogenase [Caulobacter sp. S6]
MSATHQVRKAGVVGGGVIGAGWAARLLLNGIDVALFDPDPEIERKMGLVLDNARRAMARLLPGALPPEGNLSFAASVAEAVTGADFVQESLPEREDLKIRVLADIDRATRPEVLIGSSTSGLLPTRLQSEMAHPERFVVGHPFNPVYLLPLVEICGGEKTSDEAKERAAVFYRAIGMRPLHVRKEIDGFIADRLLEAVWREALWLVNDGIATTEEIDDAIRFGAGLRWSFMGTFLIYRMAGGEAGMRHFLSQFGPALKLPWTKLEAPELTDELADRIAAQSDDQAHGVSIRELEKRRDDCLIQVLSALRRADYGAGETLRLYGEGLAAAKASTPAKVDETQALALHTATVLPDWIDYNGHMTESRYLQVFGDATDAVLAYFGAGPAYVAQGRSYFTVETHIRHLGECREGEPLKAVSQVLGADAKRLHLFHSLYQAETGHLLATGEHMLVHVDAEARRSVPAEGEVLAAVTRLAAAQSGLSPPDGAGRQIAMPAPK